MQADLPVTGSTVHKSILKKIGFILLCIFATFGFVLTVGYFAVRFGFTNTKGIIDNQDKVFIQNLNTGNVSNAALFNSSNNLNPTSSTSTEWKTGPEWQVLKSAVVRDASAIYKAASDSDIDPRLIVSILVPEQLRLFHSEREIFKEIFSPLKILGNQSQFSWGIMGIKQETAIAVEKYLKDPTSLFYPGKDYEHLLDFHSDNIGAERFARITDDKNHYWGYLYAALYLKEIQAQWKQSGYDISNRPEILATLYNIGFANSKPNGNPSSGGAEIEINGKIYSFGGLAGEFYKSSELMEVFPAQNQSVSKI